MTTINGDVMKCVKLFILFFILATKTSSFSFSQNDKEHISVFLVADDYYALFVATTMASILKNTNSFVDFYILSDGISAKNKLKISNEKNGLKISI